MLNYGLGLLGGDRSNHARLLVKDERLDPFIRCRMHGRSGRRLLVLLQICHTLLLSDLKKNYAERGGFAFVLLAARGVAMFVSQHQGQFSRPNCVLGMFT